MAFSECCVERSDDDRPVTTGQLHSQYLVWADEEDVPKAERMNVKRFGRAFAERKDRLGWPVSPATVGGRTAYRGLRLTRPSRGGIASPMVRWWLRWVSRPIRR